MGLNFCNLSPYGLNLYNNLHFSLHLYISPSTALTTAIIVCHTKLVVLFPMHFFAAKISMSFGLHMFHFLAWICTFSRATALKSHYSSIGQINELTSRPMCSEIKSSFVNCHLGKKFIAELSRREYHLA